MKGNSVTPPLPLLSCRACPPANNPMTLIHSPATDLTCVVCDHSRAHTLDDDSLTLETRNSKHPLARRTRATSDGIRFTRVGGARLNRRAVPRGGRLPLRAGGEAGSFSAPCGSGRRGKSANVDSTPHGLKRQPASPQSPQPTESAGHRPQQRPAATLPLCFRATRRSAPKSR